MAPTNPHTATELHAQHTYKRAVLDSLDPRAWSVGKQVLLSESPIVFGGGNKQATDVSKYVWFVLGHTDAEKFYTTPLGQHAVRGSRHKSGGLGWTKVAFYVVDWRAIDATLDSKLQLYKQ